MHDQLVRHARPSLATPTNIAGSVNPLLTSLLALAAQAAGADTLALDGLPGDAGAPAHVLQAPPRPQPARAAASAAEPAQSAGGAGARICGSGGGLGAEGVQVSLDAFVLGLAQLPHRSLGAVAGGGGTQATVIQ